MNIIETKDLLTKRINESVTPREVLKAKELKQLYAQIPNVDVNERREFGRQVNLLKEELEAAVSHRENEVETINVEQLDVTAPWQVNENKPTLLTADLGSRHPLTKELERVIEIFTRMGFEAIESRQIDDDYHMFGSLNFPDGHPARDGYDTFRTEEGYIPPAHTSTMENRILVAGKEKLERGDPIAVISYGRCYRNEDVDATHEHTFYQVEGMYISEKANVANMIAVLKTFFETYYGESLNVKTQPGYFPFVEPGLELLIEKPTSIGGKKGEWLEMLGCGMTHPNVLKMAGIDPEKYQGFAWGGGVDRLVMLKHKISDIRNFESGKLKFLRKF